MGNFLSLPILVIAAALQASLGKQILLLGGAPDLVFLLILSWSINAELEESVLWAFVGGICLDLLSAAPTGASIPGILIVIFGVSGLGQQVYRIGLIFLIGLVLVGSLVQQLIFAIIMATLGYPTLTLETVTYVILPTVLYNLLLVLPVYWFVRRIQRRLSRRKIRLS
ncbi:MAG: rod shape-determining protein MreD [bacterium]|nr:rod shape-determining protein MreD [bacterium]